MCNRCKGYVLVALVGGIKVAVNPTPLTPETYRSALIAKVQTYDVMAKTLVVRHADSSWGQNQSLAAHSCGASAIDVTPLEIPKAQTLASVTKPSTESAQADGSTGNQKQSLAESAIRAHSDYYEERVKNWQPKICSECREWFTEKELENGEYFAIYVSSSQWWACHMNACAKEKPPESWLKVGPKKPVYDRVDKFGKVIPKK
jgi:hypothetical protein